MLVFGCTMFTVMAFDETIMPVLVRQTKELCGPELYNNFDGVLGCTDPGTIQASQNECGVECQQRVQFIKDVGGGTGDGGCNFLETICKRATYVFVGSGECLVGNDQNVRTRQFSSTQIDDETKCSKLCDADIRCSAYGWYTDATGASTCRLYTTAKEASTGFTKPALADGLRYGTVVTPVDGVVADSKGSCMRAGRPQVIEDASQYAKTLALACGVLFIAATYTVLVNMMWVYTLNTGHKGRKGLHALQSKLCCPCMPNSADRTKKNRKQATDAETARLKEDFDQSD
jgi:hypothetical protein